MSFELARETYQYFAWVCLRFYRTRRITIENLNVIWTVNVFFYFKSIIRLLSVFVRRLIWRKRNVFKYFQRNPFILTIKSTNQRNTCTTMCLLRIQHKMKCIKQQHHHLLKTFLKDIVRLYLLTGPPAQVNNNDKLTAVNKQSHKKLFSTFLYRKLIEINFDCLYCSTYLSKVKHIQCLERIHERLLSHRHHQEQPNFHPKQPYQFKHNQRTVA